MAGVTSDGLFDRPVADAHEELSNQMERASYLTQASLRNAFARVANLEAVLNELLEALATNQAIAPEQVPLAIRAYGQQVPEAGAGSGGDSGAGLPPAELMAPGDGDVVASRWPGVVLRTDSAAGDGQPVDCAARLAVCHAVCCSLKFPLSAAELDAGKVKWDLGHPYMIRSDTSGYCCHNDRETGGCTVYQDRPGVCRGYSCAADGRIWKDFEGMVLNTEWIAEHFANPGRMHVSVRTAADTDGPGFSDGPG